MKNLVYGLVQYMNSLEEKEKVVDAFRGGQEEPVVDRLVVLKSFRMGRVLNLMIPGDTALFYEPQDLGDTPELAMANVKRFEDKGVKVAFLNGIPKNTRKEDYFSGIKLSARPKRGRKMKITKEEVDMLEKYIAGQLTFKDGFVKTEMWPATFNNRSRKLKKYQEVEEFLLKAQVL